MLEMDLAAATEQFRHFGIENAIQNFQVFCLPENFFETKDREKLFEAGDALSLVKLLREAGAACGGPADLGLDVPTLGRYSGDKWLGTVWLRDNIAVALLIGTLASLLAANIDRSLSDTAPLPPPPKVHLELYVERQGELQHLKFEGDGATLLKMLNDLKTDGTR